MDGATHAQHSQSDLIVPLLSTNFGLTEKINAVFKHYSWTKAATLYKSELIPLLDRYDIDVLYINYGQVPTAEAAEAIKGWVDADPHRILIYSVEVPTHNQELCKAYGFTLDTNETATNAVLATAYGENDLYKSIVNGTYGNITDPKFSNVFTCGGPTTDAATQAGFVPILVKEGELTRTTLAIHPTSRVVLLGDTDYFSATNQGASKDGSLTKATKGEYPLLIANLWAWITNTVLTGR